MKAVLLICGYLVLQSTLATSSAVEGGEIFKDWKVQCTKNNAARDMMDCHIFQNHVSKNGGKRVLHIAIAYVKGRKEPATIITLPLGISLPAGVAISIDGKNPMKFPYQACFKTGCQVGFPMDNKMQSGFRAGSIATITVYDLNQEPIDISVSLKGFSAAIKAINPLK